MCLFTTFSSSCSVIRVRAQVAKSVRDDKVVAIIQASTCCQQRHHRLANSFTRNWPPRHVVEFNHCHEHQNKLPICFCHLSSTHLDNNSIFQCITLQCLPLLLLTIQKNVQSKQIRAQRNRHVYVIPLTDLSMHCNDCSGLVAVSDSWETKPTHVCHVNQRTINRLCNISTPQRTCETGMAGRAHSLVHSNAGFIMAPPPEDHQSCWADQSSPSAKIFVEQPFFKAF